MSSSEICHCGSLIKARNRLKWYNDHLPLASSSAAFDVHVDALSSYEQNVRPHSHCYYKLFSVVSI